MPGRRAAQMDGASGEAGQFRVREWLEELRDLFGESDPPDR